MRIKAPALILALAVATLTVPICARGAAVRAWMGPIEIPTYLLGAPGPNPPFPLVNSHDVYPYTMLDSFTNYRVLKAYRAIYLENEYLKLTVLPELGGHLYSIYDKVDHREVLYRNHVVKYGLVGPRGAWISGGIEFSFPFAHTMVTVSRVESVLRHNADGSATAIVGAMDWVSGMHWEVALTLRPQTARVEQQVTLLNSTPTPHLYLFWANAAVQANSDMQFIYPMRETISDDPYAIVQSWPVWKGVDESWYKNDPNAMAIFARQSHRNFFGVYYHNSDYGVVHVANFRQDPGKKVWTWGVAGSGLIWAHILSDHDGPYCEIQSGRFPTQGYREFMRPRQVERWTEYWYPVRGLDGGFVQATRDVAINAAFVKSARGQPLLKLAISPAADVDDARIILKLGSTMLRVLPRVRLQPLQPVSFSIPVPSVAEARKNLRVQIRTAPGDVLLRWSAAEPVDGNPDFVPAAGKHLQKTVFTSTTPLQEVYLHGVLLEEMGRSQAARRAYEQVLQRDPGYIPALLKEALYDYRAANFAPAESLIARALGRNGEDPAAHYVAGLIYHAAGRPTLAQDAFWASIHYGGPPAPAFAELGEIAIHDKAYSKAADMLRRALDYNPADALVLSELALAERLEGNTQAALQASSQAVLRMPVLPYALAEQWQDQRAPSGMPDSGSAETQSWNKVVSADPQNYLAVAAWYHRLGAYESSDAVLHAAAPVIGSSPMVYYYLASNARHEGQIQKAQMDARKAASLPCDEVFPNRIADARVLAEAVADNPADTHAQYALGNFMFAHGRYADAANLWFKALGQGLDSSILLRNLGVYAWRVKKNLPAAAGFYARAIRQSPDDFRLYTDLDEIDAQSGNFAGRALLFKNAPPTVLAEDTVRAQYALFLTERSQFSRAIAVLMDHQFRPWEGGVEVHNIFVLANVERGKKQLGAGQPAAAERCFRRAMEYPANLGMGKPDKPDDAQQLYWLGVALQAENRRPEARTVWQQAAADSSSSENGAAIYSALAMAKLGQQGKAQQILDSCIRSAARPGALAHDYYVAGMAEHYRRQNETARADFHRALQVDPAFWQARVALDEGK